MKKISGVKVSFVILKISFAANDKTTSLLYFWQQILMVWVGYLTEWGNQRVQQPKHLFPVLTLSGFTTMAWVIKLYNSGMGGVDIMDQNSCLQTQL